MRKLDPDAATELVVEMGWSTYEVAREYGVTRQAVQYVLRQKGVVAPRRSEVRLDLPWRVRPEHNWAPELRKLRTLKRLDTGLPVRDNDKRQALNWAQQIRDAGQVLTYDTATGFGRDDRRPQDGDKLWRP